MGKVDDRMDRPTFVDAVSTATVDAVSTATPLGVLKRVGLLHFLSDMF